MKRTLFLMILALVFATGLLSVEIFAASDLVLTTIKAEEGKSIYELRAGDVITVGISLPELDDVRKFEIDLKFDESVLEYNGDVAPGNFIEGFTLATVAQMTDGKKSLPVIRFVAAATDPLSFSAGKVAFTATFTVKEDAPTGDVVPFSMENLICDDESVSLLKDPEKITIIAEQDSKETAPAPEDGKEPPQYAVAIAMCSAAAVVIAVVLVAVKLREKSYK